MPDNEEKLILTVDTSGLEAGLKAATAQLRDLAGLTSTASAGLNKMSASSASSAKGLNSWSDAAQGTITQLRKLEAEQKSLTDAQLAALKLPKTLAGASPAELQAVNKAYQLQAQSLQGVAKAAGNHTTSLQSEGYALYNVANALGVVGAGLVAIPTLTYGVSIAWEKNFANVARTSQVTGKNLDTLKQNFLDLQEAIPISSEDIAKIGTLGAQLGVSASDLTNFTKITAEFSQTAGMGVEETATALGRLDALLPDVNGNYEGLASSILKTGVNSVATEAQIVKTASQIASISNIAKLSAPQVVGLASAMASLGIPPELSRSVVTKTFSTIVRAVSEGGDSLEKFGKVVGMSGQEFKEAWNEDSFGTVRRLLSALNESGQGAVTVLDDLGLASLRNTPTLLKLAQNLDIVDTAQTDAAVGMKEAVEMSRQFGITSSTVAAKLQILGNSFEALLETIGQGGGVFGGLIDGLIGVIKFATDLSKNPVTNAILQFGIISAGAVGVLTLLAAGLAAAAASGLFLAQAFGVQVFAADGAAVATGELAASQLALAGTSSKTLLPLSAMTAQITSMGAAGRVAAVGIKLAGIALKTLGIGALVVAGAEVAGALNNVAFDIKAGLAGVDQSFEGSLNLIAKGLRNTNLHGTEAGAIWTKFGINFNRVFENAGLKTDELSHALKVADDEFAKMFQNGQASTALAALNDLSKKTGISLPDMMEVMSETSAQYDLYTEAATKGTLAQSGFNDAVDPGADAVDELGASIGYTNDELKRFQDGLTTGAAGFIDIGGAIGELQQKQKDLAQGTADSTKDSTDSWESYYDGVSISLEDLGKEMDKQITNGLNFSNNIAILMARGATNVAAELGKLGPAAAGAAAQMVTLSTPELQKWEDKTSQSAAIASGAYPKALKDAIPQIRDAYEKGGTEGALKFIAGINAAKPGVVDSINSGTKEGIDAAQSTADANPIGVSVVPGMDQWRYNVTYNELEWLARDREVSIYARLATINGVTASLNDWLSLGIRAKGGLIDGYAKGGKIPGFASGGSPGQFRGPGTGTSDSILSWVSNGEYIHTAQTTRYYGADFMDALNRRQVPKFADGGSVMSAPTSGVGMGVVELGPKSLGIMREIAAKEVSLQLDSVGVARLANRGNKQIANRGVS